MPALEGGAEVLRSGGVPPTFSGVACKGVERAYVEVEFDGAVHGAAQIAEAGCFPLEQGGVLLNAWGPGRPLRWSAVDTLTVQARRRIL